MGRSVDEVRVCGLRSGDADCRTVESCNEDLWVRVPSVGVVEVIRNEALIQLEACALRICRLARTSDICASGCQVAISV